MTLDLGTLKKRATVTIIPGSPGVAASPGRPYQPPRYITVEQTATFIQAETTRLVAEVKNGVITSEVLFQRVTELKRLMDDPNQPIQRMVYVPAVEYIPPTPAIPATKTEVLTNVNAGWNAGARSVAASDSTFKIQFTVTETDPGCIAGLNNTSDITTHPMEIGWGFYVTKRFIRVFERGSYISMAVSSVSATDVLEIQRDAAGVVKYYINSVLRYTSLVPCTGTVFFDAILYAAED